MLISCNDCWTEVSDRAPACPRCGAPVAATTTEATGKPYKAAQAIGGASILCGMAIFIAASSPVVGCSVSALGCVVYLSARIAAWWAHG